LDRIERGPQLFSNLLVLAAGVIAAALIHRWMKKLAAKSEKRRRAVTIAGNAFYFLLAAFVLILAAHNAGFPYPVVARVLLLAVLAAGALYLVFRPFILTPPFKIGNTILAGGLFGKKELMLEIMKSDERVHEKPAPKVYVLKLG
jgi:hypothetical protein